MNETEIIEKYFETPEEKRHILRSYLTDSLDSVEDVLKVVELGIGGKYTNSGKTAIDLLTEISNPKLFKESFLIYIGKAETDKLAYEILLYAIASALKISEMDKFNLVSEILQHNIVQHNIEGAWAKLIVIDILESLGDKIALPLIKKCLELLTKDKEDCVASYAKIAHGNVIISAFLDGRATL